MSCPSKLTERLRLWCLCVVCIELTFDRMTVGKIYAGLLIAENWKAFKANKGTAGDGSNAAVVSHA